MILNEIKFICNRMIESRNDIKQVYTTILLIFKSHSCSDKSIMLTKINHISLISIKIPYRIKF